MLYRDAEMIYQDLLHKWQSGTVSENQFYDSMKELQVVDADGFYWQIRATDGVWLRWNGSSWEEQPRPLDNPAQVHTAPSHQILPSANQLNQINNEAMQNQQAADQGPQSLIGLLGMILKGFVKGLPVKIGKSLVIIGIVWFFHTFLLAYVNDGYYFVRYPILGMVLSMQGNANGGTYFWTIMSGLLSTLYFRIRAEGVKPLTSKILNVPSTVISHARAPDFKGLFFILIAGAAAVLIGLHFARDITFHKAVHTEVKNILLPNRMLYMVFFLSLIVALSNQYNGFVFMVFRLVKQDANKMFPNLINPQLDPRIIYAIISGLAIGFAVMVVLPFMPYSGYILILIFIALAVMAFLNNKSVAPLYLILFGTVFAAYLIPPVQEAIACYGGFHEYGGTLDRWLNNPSGNAPTTMRYGLPPAIGAAIMALLISLINSLFPTGFVFTPPEVWPIPAGGGPYDFGDGREYYEGRRYTFDNGWEYKVIDGDLLPIRELQEGDIYYDPDGNRKIWIGGQSWHEEDWRRQAATNREYEKAHRESVEKEHARRQQELKAEEAAKQKREEECLAEREREKYLQRLLDKHGARTKKEFLSIRREDAKSELRDAQYYNHRANRFKILEISASSVKWAADTLIDVGAIAVPGGKYVKAGYKVVTGAIGQGYKDGKVLYGAAGGAIEALKDFVPKTWSKAGQYGVKFVINVGSETVKSGVTMEGAAKGFAKGSVELVIQGGMEAIAFKPPGYNQKGGPFALADKTLLQTISDVKQSLKAASVYEKAILSGDPKLVSQAAIEYLKINAADIYDIPTLFGEPVNALTTRTVENALKSTCMYIIGY